MRRVQTTAALLAIVAFATTTAWGATSTYEERHLDRLSASPAPVGPLDVGSDRAWFKLDVPDRAAVLIDASSNPTSTFFLRFAPWGMPPSGSPAPAARQLVTLSGPGSWGVELDPAVGADVHIVIKFTGRVGDETGTSAHFTLSDVDIDAGCITPEVCLP